MTITEQKYNKWKVFKKLKEMGRYERYAHHKELVLPNNNIKDIPSWIGELKELKSLSLANNNIEEIPRWIGKLKELETLDLSNNNIKKIPTETLKKCDSLEFLWLRRNPIPKKELKRTKKELNVEITDLLI